MHKTATLLYLCKRLSSHGRIIFKRDLATRSGLNSPILSTAKLHRQLLDNACLYTAVNSAEVCWNCKAPRNSVCSVTDLTCVKCNVLQRPDSNVSYFNLFDLSESFDVDQTNLTIKYRNLQTLLHPDKYVNKSQSEKEVSAEFSSLVNKAYVTLQKPLDRAVYLLGLKGLTIEETAESSMVDPEFLLEVLETSTEISQAKHADTLRLLSKENAKKIEELIDEIRVKFNENDLPVVKKYVIKLRFFMSMKDHIDKLMRERDIFD